MLCDCCEEHEAQEPHLCPLKVAQDHGEEDELCNCCIYCEDNCELES